MTNNKWFITLILAILVGGFGIDRFYTKSIWLGVAKLLTAGGFGIWWLIDIILLVMNYYHDGDGNLIESPLFDDKKSDK